MNILNGKEEEIVIYTNIYRLLALVTCLAYCIRGLSAAWLLFDSPDYLPVFANFVMWSGRLAVVLGVLYLISKQKYISFYNVGLCILPVIYFLLLVFNSNDLSVALENVTISISIIIFLLFNEKMRVKILKAFFWVVQISLIFSFLLYVFVLIGIDIGVRVVPYSYTGENLQNINYHRLGLVAVLNIGGFYRLCGLFNEPGNLGTLCSFLYIITNRYINKYSTICKIQLLLAILLSFSLAGYLIILGYFSIQHLRKKKIKNFVFLIFIVVFILIFPEIDWGNNYINVFAQRFSVTENGLSGDNRTWYGFDEQFKEVISSRKIWWGMGADFNIAGNSSYKRYIVKFGIIGFMFLMIPLFYKGFKHAEKNIDCTIFLFLFFISLYQRPDPAISLFGYMVLFGGMDWIKQQRREKNSQHRIRLYEERI